MSTIKISWGAKIAILYGGFVIIIVSLVVGSMRQSFDLVSTEYYAQELKYQEVIDAGKNQSVLSHPVGFSIKGSDLVLQFPPEFSGKSISGAVYFYSPVNDAWDKTVTIVARDNAAVIDKKTLNPITYIAKISWSVEGKSYYQETQINLSNK